MVVKCLPESPFRDTADRCVEDAIRELRRLRISQLRRMAETASARAEYWDGFQDQKLGDYGYEWRRYYGWYTRFAAACLAEIERLRGMG
jgi:hypothetical protein